MTTLLEFLSEEPFTLAMSAGFFGFYAHAGMMCALAEAKLAPSRVVGTSAGALVAGWWGSGADAEEISERLTKIQRDDFWDPSLGFGLLRGRLFRELLTTFFHTTEFSKTRVPTTVIGHDLLAWKPRVLNSGDLAAAVHASCAFPGLLQPVVLHGRPFLDGGISDRAAFSALSPGERILHHHLASRSPWRSAKSSALQVPRRQNLAALVIDDLPRLSPWKLGGAVDAIEGARIATLRALNSTLLDGCVRLSAARAIRSA